MRYDYKCDNCGEEIETSHPADEEPRLHCSGCGTLLRRKITPPSMIHITGRGLKERSLLRRDKPTNREYQAYLAWERAGGDPGTKEHRDFLSAKGEI
jgi:putative FmdB family regulatory protein